MQLSKVKILAVVCKKRDAVEKKTHNQMISNAFIQVFLLFYVILFKAVMKKSLLNQNSNSKKSKNQMRLRDFCFFFVFLLM